MFIRRQPSLNSARLKLTAWYLLIVMIISGIFSVLIYQQINDDYSRLEEFQRLRQENMRPSFEAYQQQMEFFGFEPPEMPVYYDPTVFAEARIRLQAILILINLGILSIAGVAGYFLAGRTLQPIKEMIEDQSRFITDASHELRTPLTALKTSIEVGLRDPKMTNKEAHQLLESNLEEVNNLQYLSDNLIKLTQHQKLNGAIFATVSLAEVGAEAVKKVSQLAKAKKITVHSELTEVEIDADRPSLVELLVIFLDNAVKYSHEGSEVWLSSMTSGHHVIIKVKDQGIGIDANDLLHLFDRFYRADQSRSQTSGYGLGLSIAKQIVDKHHGSIKTESILCEGTTFVINLPIKQPVTKF